MKLMRFSYQTLYSIIPNDQIPCFHRKNKLEQTAILKVNTSEHIQKKVYTFFPYVWVLQSSLVSEKNKIKLASDFKMTQFYGTCPSLCYIRIININYDLIYLIPQRFFISN